MVRLHEMGERAILVELDGVGAVMAATSTIQGQRVARAGWCRNVVDVVPAATTILLVLATEAAKPTVRQALPGILAGADPAAFEVTAHPVVTVPVRYDGPDLPTVSEHFGCAPADVITWHCETRWTSAFVGFSPGFAYLTSRQPRFVPRLEQPRTLVPAGAVGLAAEYSGIYPRPSPGGWLLIGTTDIRIWDETASPPALLAPGTEVRFVPVDAGRGLDT